MKKMNKNKVYKLIGQAVVCGTLYIAAVAGTIWAFCQNTVF